MDKANLTADLPTILQQDDTALAHVSGPAMESLPLGLRIMFDDRLYQQVERAALKLSKAEGFTPPHLLGKTEACFAVVVMALSWKLNPWNVAAATYQTPGGKVGYEGKLCQAILEASGHLEGGIKFEHYGDWSKVAGKYEVKKGSTGKDYAARTWDRTETDGLGVIVRATVKGETEPRELEFDLRDAFPLNSTLWATSPKRQICYTAVRAFANTVVPALFMGVPFDRDDDVDHEAAAKDVTPAAKPVPGAKLAALIDQRKAATGEKQVELVDADGVVTEQGTAQGGEAGPDAAQDAHQTPPVADDETVVCTFPGKEPRRTITVLAREASRLMQQAALEQPAGKNGLRWAESALTHNAWIFGHKQTLDAIDALRVTSHTLLESK